MNFDQMRILDSLLKEFNTLIDEDPELKDSDVKKYKLLFEMDRELYSADFIIYDRESDSFKLRYMTPTSLRFVSALRPDNDFTEEFFKSYRLSKEDFRNLLKTPDMLLLALIDVVKKLHPSLFRKDRLQNGENIVYNLQGFHNDFALDFLLCTSKEFFPVSLVEEDEEPTPMN
ncbi:hypothetical protein [Marinilactibacillus kalidii]|uniref:hypothetical protein n=1 Tax=Marinilactibacillus kalidii TaxID=2820274 RepID=UPI001ABEB19A|nr:hypothetical protein [Marinilactibacillus kalidii]